LIVKYP